MDVLADLLGKREINQLARGLSAAEREKADRFFKGTRVEITYRGPMRRRYRVTGLSKMPVRQCTFRNDALDRNQSVAEFFQTTYNVRLNFPELPCLMVGSAQRSIMIPMEVSYLFLQDVDTRIDLIRVAF